VGWWVLLSVLCWCSAPRALLLVAAALSAHQRKAGSPHLRRLPEKLLDQLLGQVVRVLRVAGHLWFGDGSLGGGALQ